MMVSCERHGESKAAFVCDHIIESARDGIPRGLVWERDEGHLNVCCSNCDALITKNNDDWSDELIETTGLKCICEGCVVKVADLNGVEIFG